MISAPHSGGERRPDEFTLSAEPPKGPWLIGLLLAGEEPDECEQAAIEFCDRGETVELVAIPTGQPVPDNLAAVTSVGLAPWPSDVDTGTTPILVVTDAVGTPLAGSEEVGRAMRAGEPEIEVHIRDGMKFRLASGKVTIRKSAPATRRQMAYVVGPLLVIAARKFPRPPGAAVPPPAVGPPTKADRQGNLAGVARYAGATARSTTSVRQWSIARIPGKAPLDSLMAARGRPSAPLRWLSAPHSGFWADPFVVAEGERVAIYVEDLEMATGLGSIRILEVDGDQVRPGPIVLATEHHLSFPQLYRVPGGWLGTVETCARHNPIYTFDGLGEPWKPYEGLPPLPPHLADPVLTLGPDGWPDSVIGTDAEVDSDAVVVQFLLTPDKTEWIRRDEAVRVNVTNARAGGTLDQGRGLRATQDCGGVYGRAIEIVKWPVDRGVKVALQIEGYTLGRDVRGRKQLGAHTMTWTPDGKEVWVDGWRHRPTGLGWWWAKKERAHLDVCTG